MNKRTESSMGAGRAAPTALAGARDLPWLATLVMVACLLILSSSPGFAQEADAAIEATIRLMGPDEVALPDAVTRDIVLPPALSEDAAAVERAERGLERANERGEQRENGLSVAEQASSRGAEMAENARNDREDRGRSGDRPEPGPPAEPPGGKPQ